MSAAIQVHLIDDDEAVLESLGDYLESQGLLVERHARADDAVARLGGDPAETCIVSDVRMPVMSGLDLQKLLAEQGSTVPLILITGQGDIEMAVCAVKSGAHDFLEKPFNERRLLDAIRSAVESASVRKEHMLQIAAVQARRAELSERQAQVMDLAVKGRTNKEIGLELGISPRTIEIYRARVMERMGAETLADLVRIAVLLEQHAGG